MAAVPTGECYCGCGERVGRGALFKTGHDKKATSVLDAMLHGGSVADRILDHGYGPGRRSLRAEGLKRGILEMCGFPGCNEAFTVGSQELRRHRYIHRAALLPDHHPGPQREYPTASSGAAEQQEERR